MSQRLARIGLVLVAIAQADVAICGLISPHGFFTGFPGGGHHWVSSLGPHNEHLIRDYAAAEPGLAVLLVGAALMFRRGPVLLAGIAFLAATVPHFAYHLTTADSLSPTTWRASRGSRWSCCSCSSRWWKSCARRLLRPRRAVVAFLSMASGGHLRASDSDREHVAERLRLATAEGRLSTTELEHRLPAALTARTYGELDRLIRDLPGKRVANRARSYALTALTAAAVVAAVLAVAAIVLVVLTGIAVWFGWLLIAWFFFGHRRRTYRRRYSGWELRAVNRRSAL